MTRKPRVCIFAAETLLHWSGYYVRAFRACSDCIVVGPAIKPADHDYPDWDRVASHVVPNDIHCTTADAMARFELLPEGWDPDLLVVIQSGDVAIDKIGAVGCPTTYLSVDTWHDAREYQHTYPYDFVFLAQKALVKYMRKVGCCRVYWLPLACEPESHYANTETETRHDIVFVGRTYFYVNIQRRARLKILADHVDLKVYSGMGPEEMAEVYGRGRLIFNASIACDVNMRVFEALATGRPLITNREAAANGLLELFEEGVHLITYDDDDLLAQVQRYLNDPEAARKIGAAGQREVLARHTYIHRVEQLFDVLRAHHIDVGNTVYPRMWVCRNVRDMVPLGSLRVLDMGLGLKASRVAMRHRGVEQLVGVATDAESLARRGNSYDTLWSIDDMPEATGDYDTILWSSPGRCGQVVEGVLHYSRLWLVEGGRIVFSITEAELIAALGEAEGEGEFSKSCIEEWLLGYNYRMLVWGRTPGAVPDHLIVATPISMTMDDVGRALYREFPANGVTTEPWKGFTSEPVPDSPDAEGR